MPDHIAIMDWKRNLIPKILSGEKSIESRWYMARYAPWGRVAAGDRVFFKDAGMPVTAVAHVENVVQFEIVPDTLRGMLGEYAHRIAFTSGIDEVYAWALKRRYAVLVFLERPQRVEPFEVDKAGFGNACAWMCVGDIDRVRRT